MSKEQTTTETDRFSPIMDRLMETSRQGESDRQEKGRSIRPRAKSRKRQAMGR